MELKSLIAEAWANRDLLQDEKYKSAVKAVIEEVDKQFKNPVHFPWLLCAGSDLSIGETADRHDDSAALSYFSSNILSEIWTADSSLSSQLFRLRSASLK